MYLQINGNYIFAFSKFFNKNTFMSGKQDYHYSGSSSSSNDNRALSRPVRRHLVHVYLTLAVMCAIATAGSRVGDYLGVAGSSIGSLGALTSVSMFRYTPINSRRRWTLLGVSIRGFSLCAVIVGTDTDKLYFYSFIPFPLVSLYPHLYPTS